MRFVPSYQVFLNVGALLLVLLGINVTYGWYAGLVHLIQIHPQFVPMQFNTALSFVLLGVSFLGLLNGYPVIARVLAPVVFLIGSMSLGQYLLGINLGIDELLMKHYIVTQTAQPGRMAPNTALCFILAGLGIGVSSRDKFRENRLSVGNILGSLVMGLGTVALLGYLCNIESAYGWGKLTRMAVHTSCGFILVGLMLILEEHYFSQKTGSPLPPITRPLEVAILGLTITIAFWQALDRSELKLVNSLGDPTNHWAIPGVLIFGSVFSLTLAIAVWFASQFQAQLVALQQAQEKILRLNAQLETMYYIDGLTGIANRRMYDVTVERELRRAQRLQCSLALVVIDIDCFKAYNDYYGHKKGDDSLRQVAQVIQAMARRPTDLAARYGGEEFILLLPDTTLSDAEAIAATILQNVIGLNLPHPTSQVKPIVTVSAGLIGGIPPANITIETLFERADQALYQAKAQGRACVSTTRCEEI